METFNPGYCTVEGALLQSHGGEQKEIAPLISAVSLAQGLDRASYRVSILIADSIGLLHNFPIKGEEKLYMSLKSHDLQTKMDLNLQLVGVRDVQQAGEKMTYTIDLLSTSSYEASLKHITTAFRDKSAKYCATQLFKSGYGNITETGKAETATLYKFTKDAQRVFVAEESTGKMKVTIPHYPPASAMNFMARKAYSSKSLSSMFRFFETVKGYFWVTDEWLLQNGKRSGVKKLSYSAGTLIPLDPRKGSAIIESIESLNFNEQVNTMADVGGGGYKNKVVEIDLVQHTKKVYSYDYLKSKRSYKGMGGEAPTAEGQKHSNKFIKETFTDSNAPTTFIIRDWSAPGFEAKPESAVREEQFNHEIMSNRIAYNYHLTDSSATATIKGRLDIKPGDIIDVTVQEPDVSLGEGMNKRQSGLYLVFGTEHSIVMEELTTSFSLVKYDWDKGYAG
jgi:hypothetical protein|tara:strand:+ start:198 stop:1547 length:1350 start_codon:yes stop_codon:yes gene_type:complete